MEYWMLTWILDLFDVKKRNMNNERGSTRKSRALHAGGSFSCVVGRGSGQVVILDQGIVIRFIRG
eukprot:scaffold3677_cov206-Amphora_coffeaeformis.AAC.2